MIAAPLNIVAIKLSCPGASTKLTFLKNLHFPFGSFSSATRTFFFLSSHSQNEVFAYPNLMVIPLFNSSECVSVHFPDNAFVRVVFP